MQKVIKGNIYRTASQVIDNAEILETVLEDIDRIISSADMVCDGSPASFICEVYTGIKNEAMLMTPSKNLEVMSAHLTLLKALNGNRGIHLQELDSDYLSTMRADIKNLINAHKFSLISSKVRDYLLTELASIEGSGVRMVIEGFTKVYDKNERRILVNSDSSDRAVIILLSREIGMDLIELLHNYSVATASKDSLIRLEYLKMVLTNNPDNSLVMDTSRVIDAVIDRDSFRIDMAIEMLKLKHRDKHEFLTTRVSVIAASICREF